MFASFLNEEGNQEEDGVTWLMGLRSDSWWIQCGGSCQRIMGTD